MKASDVSVRSMKSASECHKVIEQIWMDSRNIHGGAVAFMSGKQTFLTSTAKKKSEALERKAASLFIEEEC
ncbi:MAG: hypothetical protein H0X02_12355 [Nitrosomonas sp.]|nr:hypothetical protein [Nitrosomonas sp.]